MKSSNRHNLIVTLLVAAMLIYGSIMVVNTDDNNLGKQVKAMRQIDPETIDSLIEQGRLSDHPARHYEVLD